jgi:hypothetical protein
MRKKDINPFLTSVNELVKSVKKIPETENDIKVLTKIRTVEDELERVKEIVTESFPITYVSKEDIKTALKNNNKLTPFTKEIVDDLSDFEMASLASRMADDYVEQLYWSSLSIIFEDRVLEDKLRGKQ